MKINEENYIKYMKKGNDKALDYFIENHGWIIKSIIVKKMSRFPNVQEECMNDVFFAVWNNVNKFDNSKGSFLNWVAAITNYKILTYKKKYYKDFNCVNIDDMSIESDISMEKDIIQKENQQDIQNLISTLKDNDKKILIKLLIEEKNTTEISLEMGISKNVVYNRISRAKKRLRNKISEGRI